MIGLSDEEQAALMTLAAPLEPKERSRFLEAVTAELRPGEIGPGAVHRIGRQLQQQFSRTITGPAE